MTKVDIADNDRDFLAITGLWSQLMDVLNHPVILHMPSVWMAYGWPRSALQGGPSGSAIGLPPPSKLNGWTTGVYLSCTFCGLGTSQHLAGPSRSASRR